MPVVIGLFRFLVTVLLCLLPASDWAADPAAPLRLERTIALAGVSGRIDHLAIDLGRMRLLVAELGNGSVDVVDLVAGRSIHRLEGLPEPQGVAYAPESDVIAVACGGDGSVRFYRGADLTPLGSVALGADADNIRLDARTGHLIIGYGTGGLAIIDPSTRQLLGRIQLAAHPEGFQIDPVLRQVFVNVPDAREIALADLETCQQTAAWPVGNLRANFPMALDTRAKIVATVFRNPSRLVLLNASTGAEQATIPVCGDADDVFSDPERQRLYVSCGEGSVDVVEKSATGYRLALRIKTASGARTALFIPELNVLLVAARSGFFGLGSNAAILVLRVQP